MSGCIFLAFRSFILLFNQSSIPHSISSEVPPTDLFEAGASTLHFLCLQFKCPAVPSVIFRGAINVFLARPNFDHFLVRRQIVPMCHLQPPSPWTQHNLTFATMEDIIDVHLTEYIPTIYTTPCIMRYIQNGKTLERGIFAERNGVLIIVYNKTLGVLSLVKQFRPSVYLSCVPEEERRGVIDTVKYPPKLGVTLEFCAGLEDKDAPTEQIAKEEILEECGYEVSLNSLEKICSFKNLTETTGARTTLFYCEVTEDMRVSKGGGVDDEMIEVIEMPVEEVVEYASQGYVNSPMNFMFGLQWFLHHKYSVRN